MFDFLDEVFKRLVEDKEIKFCLKSRPNRIIPFPLIFRRMGVLWHFSKEDSIRILKELEKRKLIEIVNFHGIKIVQTQKS
jgi:hypothetical protein